MVDRQCTAAVGLRDPAATALASVLPLHFLVLHVRHGLIPDAQIPTGFLGQRCFQVRNSSFQLLAPRVQLVAFRV